MFRATCVAIIPPQNFEHFSLTNPFLDSFDILSKSQYGFRKEHLTQHAIVDIDNAIQSNRGQKFLACGIFIDRTAFDTVGHAILLKRLQYGITVPYMIGLHRILLLNYFNDLFNSSKLLFFLFDDETTL